VTAAAGAKKQVLLVEDSIEEVFLIRGFLEKGGFQVTTAQDGDKAARFIKEREFDLVVTDLNLPGMNGYDIIRLVKARNPMTPVLATTGYTANHYIEPAYRAGADHVLIKPLDRDEFMKQVAELAGGQGQAAAPQLPTVLAVGALPGDVEGGCAGTLLEALANGHSVLIVTLSAHPGRGDVGGDAQRRSAELMGARTITTGASVSHAENPVEHQMLLERIVRELKPVVVLIPSQADDSPARREAHRIARTVLTEVPTILAYETATSTVDFRPTRFLDIGAQMERKLEVLGAYHEHARPEMAPAYVRAAARHWGRHLDFGEAEAFEVLKDEGEEQR
jgi:CheY-like chemotaxis protein